MRKETTGDMSLKAVFLFPPLLGSRDEPLPDHDRMNLL